MTTNIMQQYIKNTKAFLKDFFKMYLDKKYIEKISNELIKTYIDARIYNYREDEHAFFYKRIEENLNRKKEELEVGLNDKEKNTLEMFLKLYQYVFYIDGVRPINDLKEFTKSLCEKRESDFDLEQIKNFESKLTKMIKHYIDQKKKFIESHNTKDFSLVIEKYINIDNTYRVNLDFNFKFPYIYSDQIIDEVYNEGTINEDKLIIEYILLVQECMKDVDDGNFDKKYLVNFARTLYKKDKKIKQTLRVLDDQVIQEKVFLKIFYSDFTENKDLIYDLIQDGFKFAIIIDDSFDVTDANLRKLNIFKYILVPKECKNYEKIMDKENKINNVIIYDL